VWFDVCGFGDVGGVCELSGVAFCVWSDFNGCGEIVKFLLFRFL